MFFVSGGLQYFPLFKTSMAGLQTHELGVLPAPHIIWGLEFMYGNYILQNMQFV
jgi:hypothetical protein